MKIGFKDFAKAKSGTVRINDLTVIFGPNNTGKTYVNYAICSILRNFESLFYAKINDQIKNNLTDRKISQIISELKSKGSTQLELPEFAESLKKFKSIATPILNSEIHKYFQISEDYFSDSNFTIELDELDLSKSRTALTTVHFGNTICFSYNYENKNSFFNIHLGYKNEYNEKFIHKFDEKNKRNKETIEYFVSMILYREHFSGLIPDPFPVTSERTGISLFYKIFDSKNSEILKSINETKDPNQISKLASLRSRHAFPIEENIENVRFYEDLVKEPSSITKNKNYDDIIEVLSTLLGNGEFESKNDSLYYKAKSPNKKYLAIPLHVASSSVKSLFLLDLFIKHAADDNSILMIDEPELNLCVANQVKMARLVARLVNSGVKVLITTHSDFLIREISNMITLNHADKRNKTKMMKEYDIRDSDLLNVSQVSAYRTHENGNIEEVEVFKSGIDTEFWNEQIQFENRKSEDIFFASGIG